MDVGIDKTGQQLPRRSDSLCADQVLLALLPRQQRQNFSVLDKQHAILKVARVAGDIVCAVADLGNIEKCAANAVW
jgi:hypothetical protein